MLNKQTNMKLKYILISYSNKKRSSKRMGKYSLNVKTIIANNEDQAIIKRDKYLKDIDADLNNFRWCLDN